MQGKPPQAEKERFYGEDCNGKRLLLLLAALMMCVVSAVSAESLEVKTFEDGDVQDRALSDWDGRWQSAYPFALNGSLDEAFELMAASGRMTAEEYKAYYTAAMETDIALISIDGNTIEYEYTDGHTCKSEYQYTGYYIQTWSGGTKAAMYRFEAADKDSGVPRK